MICLTSVSGESIDKIAEWQQPTYWEALEASTRRARWGHPINVRAAAEWSQCPELGRFIQSYEVYDIDSEIVSGKSSVSCPEIAKSGKRLEKVFGIFLVSPPGFGNSFSF